MNANTAQSLPKLGIQYFLYFGVLGVFLPYFNLYCYHIGFNGWQIGALSAARTLTTVLFSLFWAVLADHYRQRRTIYILCNFISAALWALFLLTTDFWPMLAVTLLYGIFYAPIIAFLEAFTMDALGNKKQRYGRIRVWGSLNFILVVVILGRFLDLYPVEIIVPIILAGSIFQALLTLRLPDTRTTPTASFFAGARTLLKPRFLVFLLCAFLMLVSHGTYYGFFSIHLEKLGFDRTFIGLSWALASISEIVVMLNSEKIFRRFSIEGVLAFTFLIAVLRWTTLYGTSSHLAILVSQLLHAITYGAFHIASILYVDRLVPEEAKTLGQAANNAVTYGLGITVGFLLNGWLFELLGAPLLFLISAGIAGLGWVLFQLYPFNAGGSR